MPTSLISMPSISSSGVTLIPITSFRTYQAIVEAIIVKAPIANIPYNCAPIVASEFEKTTAMVPKFLQINEQV